MDSGHLANVDSSFRSQSGIYMYVIDHDASKKNGSIVCTLWPMATPSFTSVDSSLLWTPFVRPSGVSTLPRFYCTKKPLGQKYTIYMHM